MNYGIIAAWWQPGAIRKVLLDINRITIIV